MTWGRSISGSFSASGYLIGAESSEGSSLSIAHVALGGDRYCFALLLNGFSCLGVVLGG